MATFVSIPRWNSYRDFPPPAAVSHSRFSERFREFGILGISGRQNRKQIANDEQRLIRLHIDNFENEHGPRAIQPGLVPLESDWTIIVERLIASLFFEDGLIQLGSSCKGVSHNEHVVKRFEKSVLRIFESVFDPVSTQIGPRDGYIYDLLDKLVDILTNY
jgi:hypothetical protein